MRRWIVRLERVQLLMWPVIVGFVGILHANQNVRQVTPPPLEFAAVMLALAAPILAGLLVSATLRGADLVLLALTAMLTSVGVVLLYTSGQEVASAAGFFQELALRQAMFVIAGYLAMVLGVHVAQWIDVIGDYPYTLAIAGLLLTTTTILVGSSVNGARLWLELGPLRFQPGEVSRLLLTTFMAIYLYSKRHHLAGTWRVSTVALPAAPHLVPLVVGVLIAIAVLALQNDLGMAAAIGLVAACYAAGAMWSRIGTLVTTATVALALVVAYVLTPRVRSRVELWLDPWSAPAAGGYQFVQGEFALAAAGLTGTPTMTAAARVPEFQTDFVLVALGSRFGIAVVAATLCVISLLVIRCIVVALRARSELATFVGVGIALMLGMQSILIVGGTLRLLPLTGLTVPLVSYGGTSLLVTLFAVGVVTGISAEPRWRRNRLRRAHGMRVAAQAQRRQPARQPA